MTYFAISELVKRYPELQRLFNLICQSVTAIAKCFASGGKLLVCGNGGSASDSEHIAGELMKGFEKRRPIPKETLERCRFPDKATRLQRGLPVAALSSNGVLCSAIANDLGGELVYAQQVMACGNKGDVFLGMSTSGNSENILLAADVAKALGLTTIALTGEAGGELSKMSDIAIQAPARRTADVQELHLAIYHAVCREIENTFFKE